MIESLDIVHLVRCNGEVFILASSEEGIFIIQAIGLSVVLIGDLCLEVLVESRREQAPATQVEETVSLHGQLYTALPAQSLTSIILRSETAIKGDVALTSGITGSVLLIIFRSPPSLCFITCFIRISFNLKNDY